MERGKRICITLKELRKRIADANEIPFQIEDCTHKGDCPSTCQKCESELRHLIDAIGQRESDGKPINIEGLMNEEELRQAFSSTLAVPDESVEFVTAGMPVSPEDLLIGEENSIYRYEFEIRMFGELLANSERNTNLIYSPSGLYNMLQVLLLGMDERSKVYETAVNLIGGYYGCIENNATKDFGLEHATSLWYNHELGLIKEEYIKELTDIYKTKVHSIDFADKKKTKLWIDKWVSDNTHGMIPTLNAELNEDALLVLTDAIYMKGKWKSSFDADCTDKETFHNADGTDSEVNMMYQYMEKSEYGETEEYQVINLPYMDSDYYMVVVLPKDVHSFEKVVSGCGWLDVEPIDNCQVELSMPRFEFNNTLSFVEILKRLGLSDIFETETSLPKITDEPAHISQIKQQCVIMVKEEGTEASAITIVECEVGCLPPDDMPELYKMRLDRPFAFAIKNSYDTILFMGVVRAM